MDVYCNLLQLTVRFVIKLYDRGKKDVKQVWLTKHILEFKRKILLKIHPTKTKQGNQPYLHFSAVCTFVSHELY